jgi:hypothetical protein
MTLKAAPAGCGAGLMTTRGLLLPSTCRGNYGSVLHKLEDHFDGELNLSRGGGGPRHLTSPGVQKSCPIENVCVGWG